MPEAIRLLGNDGSLDGELFGIRPLDALVGNPEDRVADREIVEPSRTL
jgi:hypothetical protein